MPVTSTDQARLAVANSDDFLAYLRETSSQRLTVSFVLQILDVAWFIENVFRLKQVLKLVPWVKHIIVTDPPLLNLHFLAVWLLRIPLFEGVSNFFLHSEIVHWFFTDVKFVIVDVFQIYVTVHCSKGIDEYFFAWNSVVGVKLIEWVHVDLVSKIEHLGGKRHWFGRPWWWVLKLFFRRIFWHKIFEQALYSLLVLG